MEKTYTIIPDFMLDFDLTITETIALAVIYGFCQDGKSDFHGSYAYLARKCKCSRQWAIELVSSLIDKGFVSKRVKVINGVKTCHLKTEIGSQESLLPVKKVDKGSQESLLGGSQVSLPNNINIENIREKKDKPISFSFLKSLMALGVSEETARDWMQVRKEQHAVNTKTAFNRIKKEIDKSGKSAEECIRTAVEKSWKGFEAAWMPKAPQKLEYFGDIEGFINARKNNGTNA